jgi:Flp pilus assembly pilin Flp
MLRRGKARRAELAGNDHGAAMAEYVPLLAVIALLVVLAVTFAGPWVSEQLIDASVPLDAGACPTGWQATREPSYKKNGQNADRDGDGWACVKTIPGNGDGNTGDGENAKDNNRGPGS